MAICVFKMAAVAILNLLLVSIFSYTRFWIVALHVHAKFCKGTSTKLVSSVKNSECLLPAILNYTVSHKHCANLSLSELRQISTSCENCWQKDGKEAKLK